MYKKRPPRLNFVFQRYEAPLYFLTFNTYARRALLAHDSVHRSLRAFADRGKGRGYSVGCYMIMPDHIHLFLRKGPESHTLGRFIGLLKQCLSKSRDLKEQVRPHWQEGFFDHLMRSTESYAEKWEYVRQNPVRGGLVASSDDWPYQGEIVRIPF